MFNETEHEIEKKFAKEFIALVDKYESENQINRLDLLQTAIRYAVVDLYSLGSHILNPMLWAIKAIQDAALFCREAIFKIEEADEKEK